VSLVEYLVKEIQMQGFFLVECEAYGFISNCEI
jgi:hypothetical protein